MPKRFLKYTNRINPEPAPSQGVRPTAHLIGNLNRFAWDAIGLACIVLAILTFLGLADLTSGIVLIWWADLLSRWFGWGDWIIVFSFLAAGVHIIRQQAANQPQTAWGRVLALEVAAFSLIALLTVLGGASLARAEAGLDGGLIGWGLVELPGLASLPLWLRGSILVIIFFASALGGSGFYPVLYRLLTSRSTLPSAGEASWADAGSGTLAGSEPQPDATLQAERKPIPRLPAEYRKKFKIRVDEQRQAKPPVRDDRLPPLDLLVNEQLSRPDERNINLTAGLIEKTLAEFGIPAKVVGFQVGPTVTQFAVEPGFVSRSGNGEDEAVRQKVRVAQIASLSRDLALALSASSLRIEAPVPGRPYVGIEVPNNRSSLVRLRPILEAEAFYKFGSPLTIALGRDVSGQAVVADLASMPHLLIAGTTGSGKSVCIAALTLCLVMNNTPQDLRLVMIDPKMVELVRFNGLPHLFGKVETDLQRILGVLRWTVAEMDRRYKLLEASRSRNIDTYNRKARRRKGEEPLPHIVVMIDELADLMMSAPEQTEPALVRLAQMARATGIHLVVATQRPSTDVVTGLIKANFPARISFAVASSVDSRVILDLTGAEALLGRGDMLFLPPEAGSPIRAQGVMVTDQEIERVITFWQQTHPPDDLAIPPWESILEEQALLAEKDDLIEQAIAIVRETQRASASLLQRRLRIGYPRAARLIDELEEMGVVGPAQGGGREREVLITREDDDIA